MFSFMILTKNVNRKNLKKAEKMFSIKFNSGSNKFITGFSFTNNLSITCGKNSLQFSLYDQAVTKNIENLIENYFLLEFDGKIDGVFIERDLDKYSFLNQFIEKELVIN